MYLERERERERELSYLYSKLDPNSASFSGVMSSGNSVQ